MAGRVDNDIYLTINGVSVCAYFKEVELKIMSAGIDITAGCAQDWEQIGAGMLSSTMSAQLTYDDTNVDDYLATLKPGQVITVVYGPEGNTAGKPKHEQLMHIESVTTGNKSVKDAVIFDIEMKGADTPTAIIFDNVF